MKIWLLKIGEPIPVGSSVRKLRTAMMADKLAERGHEVLWWTSAFDHHKKTMVFKDNEEIVLHPRIRVKTLMGMAYGRNVSLKRYADHWIISKKFKHAAGSEIRPDVIVTAMPDYHLAYEAVSFARRYDIPVFVDIRDQWPDVFLDALPRWARPLLRKMLFYDYGKLSALLAGSDGIFSATSTWLDWALEKTTRARKDGDRVFFLGAPKFIREHSSHPESKLTPILKKIEGRFVLTFIGTFSHVHNPASVVDAAKELKRRGTMRDQPFFILAGDGPLRNQMIDRAQGMENILFPGWIDGNEITELLSVSSVGLVPFGVETDQFPNKAFTYLSAGLPVLSCDRGDLSRLLLAYRAGYHFSRSSPPELADLIEKLSKDPALCDEMRGNAGQLFQEKLDAEKIYTAFAEHVEKFACRPGRERNDTLNGPVCKKRPITLKVNQEETHVGS